MFFCLSLNGSGYGSFIQICECQTSAVKARFCSASVTAFIMLCAYASHHVICFDGQKVSLGRNPYFVVVGGVVVWHGFVGDVFVGVKMIAVCS